ncbi:MAG: hypothetical protein LJE91_01020, partial [Gammaproteobacteria bacterium]|nr:hypothetical protein [Gammaproteobacteria bacterium]
LEAMPRMSGEEHEQLKDVMRAKYAVHYTKLVDGLDGDRRDDQVPGELLASDGGDPHTEALEGQGSGSRATSAGKGKAREVHTTGDPDTPSTGASPEW